MTEWDWAFALGKSATAASENDSHESTELQWSNHYQDAKNVAMQENRPLVIVVNDSSDSTYEDKLDPETKQTLLEEKFELVKVDTSTDYGHKVATALEINEFPYTIITKNDASEIVLSRAGHLSKHDWRVALAKSLETEDKRPVEKQVTQLIAKVQPITATYVAQAAPVPAVTHTATLFQPAPPAANLVFSASPSMFFANQRSFGSCSGST